MATVIVTIYLSCMPAVLDHDVLIALKTVEMQERQIAEIQRLVEATKGMQLPPNCEIRYALKPKKP